MRLMLFSLLFACGEEKQTVEPSLMNKEVEEVKKIASDEEPENTEKVEETTSQEETETQGD